MPQSSLIKIPEMPAASFAAGRSGLLQRKNSHAAAPSQSSTEAPPIVHDVLRSTGQPLDGASRAFMEPRFGYDFSRVRVHSDSRAAKSAEAVNAQAYTVGSNIVLGANKGGAGNGSQQRLLAHELTHVVQQGGRQPGGSLQVAPANDSAEREAGHAETHLALGQPAPVGQQTGPRLARKPDDKTGSKAASDPVVSVTLNLTSHKTVFRTSSGAEYQGSGETDLDPGVYELSANKSLKKWFIKNTGGGLRFDVELNEADPWTLTYPRVLQLQVVQGTKNDLTENEVLDSADTVDIAGDPAVNGNYIQNAIKAVAIFGWGGPFRLFREVNAQNVGSNDILLSRTEFHLDDNPIGKTAIALNKVYKTRAAADAAVKSFGVDGAYAFYLGPGGHIYPTVISDSTAPVLCTALRAAVQQERGDAKAAENLSIQLLLWYVGARFPAKADGEPPPTSGIKTPPTSGGSSTLGTATKATTAAGGALAGGGEAFTVVEIGAGDLKASIELAKKGGVRVIAVDPAQPAAEAVKQLQSLGGTFVKGTAQDLTAGSANQVFQYFPWQIEGTGSFVSGGTWRLVDDTVKLLKPNGNAYFVTESKTTAEFLAGEASKHGLKAALTDSTAAAAAPGASGAGVPGFAGSMKTWLVNIYK